MSRLFETVSKQIKSGGKVHVTYIFVVAQLNMPTMTAPLSHGKQREEAHTFHVRPATPSPAS